jgi:hypothetical protein
MATDCLNRLGIRDPILLAPSHLAGGPSTPGAGRRRFQTAVQRERLTSSCVPGKAWRGHAQPFNDLVQRLIEEMDGKF